MNILKFELKNNFKSFVIWTISIVLLYIVLMGGMYSAFTGSIDEVQKVYANFPPQFAAAFGLNMSFLFSYGGFYGFTFTYLAIVASIMATSFSLSTFSREKRSKCMDFIYSKPVKRQSVFLYKLSANVLFLVLSNVILIGTGMIMFYNNDVNDTKASTFLVALLSLFFSELVFLSFGIILATFMKKIRSVSGIATSIGFGAFILSALVNIIKEDWLKVIAPLKYFDPNALLQNGKYEVKYVIAAILISLACIVISYMHICNHDVHAV